MLQQNFWISDAEKLWLDKRHKSPAHKNAKLGTITYQYHIIYLLAYQNQGIQYHPKQKSTHDMAGRNCSKKKKLQYAASRSTVPGGPELHLNDIYG